MTAGMRAAKARGRRIGRPPTPARVIAEIEDLAASTDLSIRQIHEKIARRASRGRVGECKARPIHPIRLMTTFYTYLQPTASTFSASPRCGT